MDHIDSEVACADGVDHISELHVMTEVDLFKGSEEDHTLQDSDRVVVKSHDCFNLLIRIQVNQKHVKETEQQECYQVNRWLIPYAVRFIFMLLKKVISSHVRAEKIHVDKVIQTLSALGEKNFLYSDDSLERFDHADWLPYGEHEEADSYEIQELLSCEPVDHSI